MTPVTPRWIVRPRDTDFETRLAREAGIHPITAAVLRGRNVCDAASARAFLQPSAEDLYDPFCLPDMDRAVDRVLQALDCGEKILAHGDYDADGITSTALLCRFLEKLGGNVTYFIPHRVRDSYGLNPEAMEAAADEGIGLVIAVDCGISAHRAIEVGLQRGIDTVVIDHHEPGRTLPPAVAVVDHKRADSTYPEDVLASVGLVFKVASAICARKGLPQASLQRAYLDLVAIGTIADVAPLVGENRIMTRLGLDLLPQTKKVGLQALMRICNMNGAPRASDIAFRIGPRLNAVGRMSDASEALELLLTADEAEAQRLAMHLDTVNRERQQEQECVLREAIAQVEAMDLQRARVLVLSSPRWHVGVLGIVAAKLLEQYGRPTIMLTEEDNETARGSARSLPAFDINAALAACSEMLLRHGGHTLAAGLAIQMSELERFRDCLGLLAERALSDEDVAPCVEADVEARLFEIDAELITDLRLIDPCGNGNPHPLLVSRGVEIIEARRVGRDEQHLKLYVGQDEHYAECIGFGLADGAQWAEPGARADICYCPELNDYNGRSGIQLRLEAIRPAT